MTGPVRGSFDWAAAYVRLERLADIRAAREPEERARVLAARARELARMPRPKPGADLALLTFPVASERYAVEVQAAVEVVGLGGLTRLPWAPPAYVGLLQQRGRLVPVVDLRRLAGEPPPLDDGISAVVVREGEAVFGLLTTGPAEIVHVSPSVLAPPPGGRGAGPFVGAITCDAIAVLDLDRLLKDPAVSTRADAR